MTCRRGGLPAQRVPRTAPSAYRHQPLVAGSHPGQRESVRPTRRKVRTEAPGCQRAASGRVTSSDRGQGGCQRPGRTPVSRARRVGALTSSRPHPGEDRTLTRTAPPSRTRTWAQRRPASRTAPVLTANKYRSHEQQVPFSRRISTVLAVRGWGG